jgi:hypothetical protein
MLYAILTVFASCTVLEEERAWALLERVFVGKLPHQYAAVDVGECTGNECACLDPDRRICRGCMKVQNV